MFLSADDMGEAVEGSGTAQFDAACVYDLLMRNSGSDEFDLHVVACILSVAVCEASAAGRPVSATSGLEPAALATLADDWFPHAARLFPAEQPAALQRDADEACLLDLLAQCATDGSAFQIRLAGMIARRAQSANHLWQDLGLRDRGELSRLMNRHFRSLAARNTGDMKWKKFLYRMICRDAGYSICTAPSCSECCDFEVCFGDESGESRLARVRRTSDLDDAVPAAAQG